MDRNQRLALLLGIFLIVAAIVVYYLLLLGPLREEYGQRLEERENKQAQLAQLQAEVRDLEELQSQAPEIERQFLELSKRLPENAEISTLLVQIQEIANAAGVTQLSIEPGAPEPPPGGGDFQRVPVTMSFEGTYVQMQDFLNRTRNLVRLMSVNEVTYGLAEAEETTAEATMAQPGVSRALQVEISAEVYVQPTSGPTGLAPSTPGLVDEGAPEGIIQETAGGS